METNQAPKNKKIKDNISLLLKQYKKRLLCNTLLSFCIGGIFAIVAFYSLPFMKFSLNIDYGHASIFSLIFFWIIIISSPLFGKLFDHTSTHLVYFFIITLIIASIIFIPYLSTSNMHFVFYFIVVSFLLSAIRGAVLIELSKGLPDGCNCLAINMTYTIGITLAAFIPALLVSLTPISFIFLPITIAILGVILLFSFLSLGKYATDSAIDIAPCQPNSTLL